MRIRSPEPKSASLPEAVPRRPPPKTDQAAASRILRELDRKILSCALCPLSRERTHAVPGEGHDQARLMFVGEAPGADEDSQGKPFIGRAGQLLTKIITAMGFSRQDVYITNVVKCRPPKNRTPVREEIEACRRYLEAQIEAIAPKVIVSLGKVATDFFYPSPMGMSKRRGQFVEYGEILVMPTFHPSYLIRNEGNRELRKAVWSDMKQVMAVLNE
ncbi:MAG: uracil-DNA glycosylase [Candidatus Aminicenantes bacterium]|nr:uracil-DNA glycosylase [Candidatus Aminicenantes bacterium]